MQPYHFCLNLAWLHSIGQEIFRIVGRQGKQALRGKIGIPPYSDRGCESSDSVARNAVVAWDMGQNIAQTLTHHFRVVVGLQCEPAFGIDAKESAPNRAALSAVMAR